MFACKPIETYYNGYRFRSRLEAKWAVFFDNAKIKYVYEIEGFQKNKKRYLPDFYLPDFDMYVEVKPPTENSIDGIKKAWDMIDWGGGIKKILVLGNIPPHGELGQWYFPIIYYGFDGKTSDWWTFFDIWEDDDNQEDGYKFIKSDGCLMRFNDCIKPIGINDDGVFYCSVDAKSEIELKETSLTSKYIKKLAKKDGYDSDEYDNWVPHVENPQFFNALDKARQARFEFGEKG